jgi:hypothetical protein
MKVSGRSFLFVGTLLGSVILQAQQPIGTVGVQDATVAGALEVTNGRAVLVGSTTVTAKDHVADIALSRGGSVEVCSTSGLHVTSGKSAIGGAMPLMLALDRGAIEVRMTATTSDVVLTPDLRFTMRADGPLDLRVRVISNGDTCVENRGENAPVLNVAEQFGDGVYELRAGQHVLFEHGSLKEVVDNESSACGCPPVTVISVADAGVTSATPAAPGSPITQKTPEQQHPFPAAVSAGLAPSTELPPQAPPGEVHTQVATSLHYDAGEKRAAPAGAPADSASDTTAGKTSTPAAPPVQPATVTAQAPPPPAAVPAKDLVHIVGRFFKRLFGG